MKTPKRTGRGGSYFKATPDSEPVLVEGTDQKPDPKALEAVTKPPKAKSTTKGGDQ